MPALDVAINLRNDAFGGVFFMVFERPQLLRAINFTKIIDARV